MMLDRLGRWVIPTKIIDAFDEVDIGLLKDCCVLERGLDWC